MQKAVCYARYSSDMQREESIDAQLRAAREYCKKKGYYIVKEYFDEAKTGKTDNRPSYKQMLADAKNKLFDVIIFHKIDRNARNEYDYYFHKAALLKLNIRLEYAAQQIDDSPEGQMMENLLVGMAAYYSRNLSKEVMKGLMENAFKGRFCGGVPPLGFDIQKGNYVINERESATVKLIFKLYLSGFGYSRILTELNQLGHKTKNNRSFGKNSLSSILSNPRYVGDFVFNKVNVRPDGTRNSNSTGENMLRVPNVLPKIIEREVFDAVQERMKINKKRAGAFTAKHSYLLSGLLECGECGASMIGRATTTRGKKYFYYKCGGQDRKCLPCDCGNAMMSSDDLEKIVLDELEKNIFQEKSLEILTEKISTEFKKKNSTIEADKARLVKRYETLMKNMDKIYTIIENDTEDEYDYERLKKIKAEATEVKNQLRLLEVQTDQTLNINQIRVVINSYRDMLKKRTNDDEIRILLNTFIQTIIIDRQNITIRFKIEVGGVSGVAPSAPVINRLSSITL